MVYMLKTDTETRAHVQLLVNFKGMHPENILSEYFLFFTLTVVGLCVVGICADLGPDCSLFVKSTKFSGMTTNYNY